MSEYPWISRGYVFQRLHETRNNSLKEHQTVFLKGQNLIFSIVAGKYLICFLHHGKCFKRKFSNNLLSPLGA